MENKSMKQPENKRADSSFRPPMGLHYSMKILTGEEVRLAH